MFAQTHLQALCKFVDEISLYPFDVFLLEILPWSVELLDIIITLFKGVCQVIVLFSDLGSSDKFGDYVRIKLQ